LPVEFTDSRHLKKSSSLCYAQVMHAE
jgi:hypothetical protein